MFSNANTVSLDTKRGQRRFVINLLASENGPFEVRSCEVQGNAFRNRTSFSATAMIEDVFIPQIAKGLRRCLAGLSDRNEVIARPDLVLEAPGLSLSGMHLMVTKRDDGTTSIMMRFRSFLGGINRAFRDHMGFDDMIEDRSAHMSALVLADLAMPLLDICTAAEAGLIQGEKGLEKFGAHLSQRAEEIRFQVELIKRYVDGQQRQQGDLSALGYDTRRAVASDIEPPEMPQMPMLAVN